MAAWLLAAILSEGETVTYNPNLTWAMLEGIAGNHARILISTLYDSKRAYDEWQSFRGGRTDGEIATALGKDVTDIQNIDACFAAMIMQYNYADNQTPVQGDYFYALRLFS